MTTSALRVVGRLLFPLTDLRLLVVRFRVAGYWTATPKMPSDPALVLTEKLSGSPQAHTQQASLLQIAWHFLLRAASTSNAHRKDTSSKRRESSSELGRPLASRRYGDLTDGAGEEQLRPATGSCGLAGWLGSKRTTNLDAACLRGMYITRQSASSRGTLLVHIGPNQPGEDVPRRFVGRRVVRHPCSRQCLHLELRCS